MRDAARGPGYESWSIRKPSVRCAGGVVASPHYAASRVGARVLAPGGNAVDAAVAAGLALGAVEPWMSGLGGGGYMLVYLRSQGRTHVVDFAMRAPAALDPADYPLAGGTDHDLFGWPAVVEGRNVVGPLSFAVPGLVAGHALALERFGTWSWPAALSSAIELAAEGLLVDWYGTLKIASEARNLARFPESSRVYLPDGFAPAGGWGGPLPRIRLGRLAETLERLSLAGPRDFYEGELATAIAADARECGAKLSLDDLARYRARVVTASVEPYRGATVHAAPALTAGPTLQRALKALASRLYPGTEPDLDAYAAYAECLLEAYAHRLATLGDSAETDGGACTTHISVADADGNLVALTQTLLSVFGSKVMLPQTGVLMNNGVMWFDPRPGRPNSIAPGKRPLANMCPAVVVLPDGVGAAIGASGGRRIMPAVMQLLSFLVDYGMDLDTACHQPRIDASGGPQVTVDSRLSSEVVAGLTASHRVDVAQHGVYPALFACPNMTAYHPATGMSEGAAYVMSPWAEVAAANRP